MTDLPAETPGNEALPGDESGNGAAAEQEFTIDRLEMGPGWVCFQVGQQHPPVIEQIPGALNHCFYTWLQRNPEFQVRATLPVTEGGCTVAIHVWFD